MSYLTSKKPVTHPGNVGFSVPLITGTGRANCQSFYTSSCLTDDFELGFVISYRLHTHSRMVCGRDWPSVLTCLPLMNVTASTEQESCSSHTRDSRIFIEQPRQRSENECWMNDANVPVLWNVVTNDHNLYTWIPQSWIRRMLQSSVVWPSFTKIQWLPQGKYNPNFKRTWRVLLSQKRTIIL